MWRFTSLDLSLGLYLVCCPTWLDILMWLTVLLLGHKQHHENIACLGQAGPHQSHTHWHTRACHGHPWALYVPGALTLLPCSLLTSLACHIGSTSSSITSSPSCILPPMALSSCVTSLWSTSHSSLTLQGIAVLRCLRRHRLTAFMGCIFTRNFSLFGLHTEGPEDLQDCKHLYHIYATI